MRALLCLLLLVAPVLAVQEPEVDVRFASPLIKLGGEASLIITVEDQNDVQIVEPLPAVAGLTFSQVMGPSTEERIAISQGRALRRRTMTWVVDVRPTAVGTFEVPPITLRIDGEEVTAPDGPLSLRVIADEEGAELGFFELEVPRRVFEGQPFTLEARFGFDSSVPVQRHDLFLPWWDSLRGLIELETSVLDRGRNNIVVNDRVQVDVEHLPSVDNGGNEQRPFQLRRRFLPSRSGRLELDTSTYCFSVLVERGIGHSPDKWRHYYAQSAPVTIDVVPIPEDGRPFEWTGAVGHLEVSRRVDRRDLSEGDPVQLTVSWTGDANLAFFDAPDLARLDAFSGFRVVGTTEESFPDERRIRYDLLVANAEVDEIPPVPLWTFDPTTERFTLIETRSVPLRVRAVEGSIIGYEELETPDAVDLADLHSEPRSTETPAGVGGAALAWTGASLLLGWVALRSLVRKRLGDPDGPLAKRRRAAPRRLRRELAAATTASAQAVALARYLAARTGEPDAAWVGRDVRSWAETATRFTPEAVEALTALERDLDERAWAAGDQPLAASQVQSVAEQVGKGGPS